MYYLNIIFPVILYFLLILLDVNRNVKFQIYDKVIFVYIVIFLSCFDYRTFPDIDQYNEWYNYLLSHSIPDFYNNTTTFVEYGYIVYCKILTYLSSNPRIVYILRGVLFAFCILSFIKKYSTHRFLSILFLFLYFRIESSIYIVRQYMGIAIYVLSVDAVINKQLKKYLLIWAIAFSFHLSLIILLPLYWIYNYISVKKVSSVWLISIIGILSSFIVKKLFDYVSNSFGLYAVYLDAVDSEFAATGGIVLRTCVVFLPFLFFCSKRIIYDEYARLFFWAGLFNVIFSIAVQGINNGERLFYNYNIFSIIIIPYVVSCIKGKDLKIIYLSILILALGYFYFAGIVNPKYPYYLM